VLRLDDGEPAIDAMMADGPSSAMTTVLVCDDSAGYCNLIREWARDTDDISVVALASTVDELVAQARAFAPDVVVLDHSLGAATSQDMAPKLRDVAPTTRVLLVSGMPGDALSEHAARCGADGFIGKASGAQAILDAIRNVRPRRTEESNRPGAMNTP